MGEPPKVASRENAVLEIRDWTRTGRRIRKGRTGRRVAGPAAPKILVTLTVLTGACAPGEPAGGPTAPTGEISLAWDAPNLDTEGNPLGGLHGYRIYYATASPVTRETADVIEVGDGTWYTFSGLGPGVYHLAVAAVDTAGNESELSEEVRAEVAGS